MSITEDLINFDIIETQKENIQSLPGGRSAKALAATYAPTFRTSGPSPNDTRNFTDAIRQEYELEIIAIADSDDPLDVYDRYVKWTFSAYPSAQATPESQLRPLLERATKAFQSAPHYKNDPRYLKLWLNYIRFFSDSPRETFAYLARHNIGDGLALFYEEFAAWLEGAGRWTQADEVYRLGVEREARPTERLARKFGEFQHRFEHRTQNGDEPSSPALPTVRPALAAKIDPFAITTPRPNDPQAQRQAGIGGTSTARPGKQKLAIFSDSDGPASSTRPSSGGARGWDNIGSIADRKKENTIEARPWAGETMKAGKKASGPPKMMIFKDESNAQVPQANECKVSRYSEQQQVTNPKTGKIERVFVDLESVYPNPNDPSEEMSFEELRARSRGWLNKDWGVQRRKARQIPSASAPTPQPVSSPASVNVDVAEDTQESLPTLALTQNTDNGSQPVIGKEKAKPGRPKKMKVMEVKGETQTIKTNLASPTGPKIKRKISAEPTMTLHTKAATEDILDIFNQPLRNMGPLGSQADSVGESDYDDDDYTSAGESTGTGHISGTSEYGEDDADSRSLADMDETNGLTGSPWSDFTKSKHVPRIDSLMEDGEHVSSESHDKAFLVHEDDASNDQLDAEYEMITPVSEEPKDLRLKAKFIPLPPEDFEAPTHPYRDPSQAFQNRLPFMTPIVEKTESSMGALTIREEKDYFNSKTPSRQHGDGSVGLHIEDELLSSPFQEIINEAKIGRQSTKDASPVKSSSRTAESPKKKSVPKPKVKGPIIKDGQCNPINDSIKNSILGNLNPPLSAYAGFHDHRPSTFNKGPEIRKFVKALAKISKNGSDKTTTNLSIPPTLAFPSSPSTRETFTIKLELGKGAFAPVYLAEQTSSSTSDDPSEPPPTHHLAMKCEHPPTPWEFYIMSTLHTRLSSNPRATTSLLPAHSLHLFADEGYLLESYMDQGTLLDLVNTAKASEPSGTLDECVAMFFTVELLRTVEAMHSVGIMHGDLKADNCLVRLPPLSHIEEWDSTYHADGSYGWSEKGLSLIDFGRGIDMRHFRPEVQFVADWKTTKADCAEMREMRPWTWQVDYWGMAGVIHSLLFGRYIEDVAIEPQKNDNGECGGLGKGGRRYKLKESLKRYWQTEIWGGVFEMLLNPGGYVEGEEGGKMPIQKGLRGVRVGMEEWLGREGGKRGLKASLRRLEGVIKEGRRK